VTRPNLITLYEVLPRWRCIACKYEMECVGKGKNRLLTAHAAHRKFKIRHKLARSNCPGEFTYLTGKKKSEA
jgi:hypothetical protein